jgi:hypothetical protein
LAQLTPLRHQTPYLKKWLNFKNGSSWAEIISSAITSASLPDEEETNILITTHVQML